MKILLGYYLNVPHILKFFICLLTFFSLLYIFLILIRHFGGKEIYSEKFFAHDDSEVSEGYDSKVPKGYAIYKPGCKIQDFDPYDAAVKKYIDRPYVLTCSKGTPLATVNHSHIITIDFNSLSFYGGYLNYCLYIPIFRVEDGTSDNGFRYGRAERFYDFIRVKHEFVKVECYNLFKKIYEDFFPFIFKKRPVEQRCQKIQENHQLLNEQKERLSVAIIGIDSVSRINFLRFCPKTRDYLVNEMKAIEFKGYSKVGDNTFHNLVPLLSGFYISELDWNNNQSFDKFSFIWKEYAAQGYRTMFSEDDPNVSLFNYLKYGFFHTPADYYIRPLYVAYNRSKLYHVIRHACMANRFHTNVMLQYAKDFLKTFQNELYFSFLFITSMTHGHLTGVRYGEIIYQEFFKNITDENLLNNTILFFLSDHGIRFGKLRGTYVGRIEERLPMAYIVFPNWFKQKYPDIITTVKRNSLRLTTPFDIYATLKELLHFAGSNRKSFNIAKRSVSLFDEISDNRRCEDASILPHWCTCQEKRKMPLENLDVIMSAMFVVNYLNNLTLTNRNICYKLSLKTIISAWGSSPNEKFKKYKFLWGDGNNEKVNFNLVGISTVKDIIITLRTVPGNAEFEATVRYDERSGKITLSADISRINEYGNQSSCVQDYNLRKYCYCKQNK